MKRAGDMPELGCPRSDRLKNHKLRDQMDLSHRLGVNDLGFRGASALGIIAAWLVLWMRSLACDWRLRFE